MNIDKLLGLAKDDCQLLQTYSKRWAKGVANDSNPVAEVMPLRIIRPTLIPIYIVVGILSAIILDSALKFYRRGKPVVILIEVSHEWAKARLLARGRGDDDPGSEHISICHGSRRLR